MATREGMADLIDRVRTLIRDPAGAAQVFSYGEIQDVLDRHRIDVERLELDSEQKIVSGELVWGDYYAPYGDWEDDPVLRDSAGDELTPAASDLQTGRWTITDQRPPVYLEGRSYDLYGAAADLLEQRAVIAAPGFDFQADGARFDRSQVTQAYLTLAQQYRGRARIKRSRLQRDDIN